MADPVELTGNKDSKLLHFKDAFCCWGYHLRLFFFSTFGAFWCFTPIILGNAAKGDVFHPGKKNHGICPAFFGFTCSVFHWTTKQFILALPTGRWRNLLQHITFTTAKVAEGDAPMNTRRFFAERKQATVEVLLDQPLKSRRMLALQEICRFLGCTRKGRMGWCKIARYNALCEKKLCKIAM